MDSENFTNSGFIPQNENQPGANVNMNNQFAAPANDFMRTANGGSRMFGFNSPPQENFNTDEMRGSMQNILSQNVGEYVVAEFLIGTGLIMRKQGILYDVGTSFVTLFDDRERNFIVCDIFSIKFVYFYYPGDRPSNVNFNVFATADVMGDTNMGTGNGNVRGRGMRR